MLVKFAIFVVVGLVFFCQLEAQSPAGITCGKGVCKANEDCSYCGQNPCNTYTCEHPTPACAWDCAVSNPKCVCKPGFERKTPDGPCVPLILSCPPKPGIKCGVFVCGKNEECSYCGQNHCNTYTCEHPKPPCAVRCAGPNQKCVCKPGFKRILPPNGPCVPLKCPPKPGIKCGVAACGKNEECSYCGQNRCNTYTCENPTPPCAVRCASPKQKCVCKPGFERKSPNGPCVPLSCPSKLCQ